MITDFYIKITPRPAPRPRLGKYGAYNESWYTSYKKELILKIKTSGLAKLDYSILYIQFGLPYPKTVKGGEKMRIEGAPHRNDNGDVDNFIKPVKDALQQSGLINNDCQFYLVCGEKTYTKSSGFIFFALG